MTNTKSTPTTHVLLKMVKGLKPIARYYETTGETLRLEQLVKARLAVLLKDPIYRSLKRKAEQSRRSDKRKTEKAIKERRDLVNSIQIDGPTDANIRKVKKAVGLK